MTKSKENYRRGAAGGDRGRPSRDADPERDRLRRDQQAITVARYERDLKGKDAKIAALEGKLNDLLVRYQRKEREGDLKQLLAEGYEFDLPETLDRLAGLPRDRYDAEVATITKYYRQNPVNQGLIETEAPATPGEDSGRMTAEESQEVIRYARDKGLPWDEAVAEYREKKKAGRAGANGHAALAR